MPPEAPLREAALRAISRQQRGLLPSSALDEAFPNPATRLICCYAALVGGVGMLPGSQHRKKYMTTVGAVGACRLVGEVLRLRAVRVSAGAEPPHQSM